jgi:hypothetical protein
MLCVLLTFICNSCTGKKAGSLKNEVRNFWNIDLWKVLLIFYVRFSITMIDTVRYDLIIKDMWEINENFSGMECDEVLTVFGGMGWWMVRWRCLKQFEYNKQSLKVNYDCFLKVLEMTTEHYRF